jgi:hypothetical protein
MGAVKRKDITSLQGPRQRSIIRLYCCPKVAEVTASARHGLQHDCNGRAGEVLVSTERSRQRADKRSKSTTILQNSRKYHNTTITYFDINDDLWTGVILPPHYRRSGPKNVISNGTRYNVHGLMAHLFFWDRVAIPRPSKLSDIPDNIDLAEYCHDQTLSTTKRDQLFEFIKPRAFESQKFNNRRSLRKSEVYDIPDIEWENQVQTYFTLEEKNPGLWSIADPYSQHRKLKVGRSMLVRLYDAIPVPSQGVQLLEVVEFKSGHIKELKQLRAQLAKLYLKIESSQDNNFSFHTEFSDLKASIADLTSSMEKSGLSVSFASIDARLKWDFDYRIPLAAGIVGGTLDSLQTALIFAAGGLGANIIPKVEVTASKGKLPDTKNPLAYSYLVSKAFGDSLPYASLSSESFIVNEIKEINPRPERRKLL